MRGSKAFHLRGAQRIHVRFHRVCYPTAFLCSHSHAYIQHHFPQLNACGHDFSGIVPPSTTRIRTERARLQHTGVLAISRHDENRGYKWNVPVILQRPESHGRPPSCPCGRSTTSPRRHPSRFLTIMRQGRVPIPPLEVAWMERTENNGSASLINRGLGILLNGQPPHQAREDAT